MFAIFYVGMLLVNIVLCDMTLFNFQRWSDLESESVSTTPSSVGFAPSATSSRGASPITTTQTSHTTRHSEISDGRSTSQIGVYSPILSRNNSGICFRVSGIFSFVLRYRKAEHVDELSVVVPKSVETSGGCTDGNSSSVTMKMSWNNSSYQLLLTFQIEQMQWYLSSFHISARIIPNVKDGKVGFIEKMSEGQWFITPRNHTFKCHRERSIDFRNGSFTFRYLSIQPITGLFDDAPINEELVTTCTISSRVQNKLVAWLIVGLVPLAIFVCIGLVAVGVKRDSD